MTSRNSPSVEILYLYRIPRSSYLPYLSIRSRFDGTERDRARLERVAFGEAARALCASVPDALRPTPKRVNPDAAWLDPRAYRGPLTICMAGLAFDLPAGANAILPWSRSWPRFRISLGGRNTDIDLLLWQPLAEPPPGPLADSPAIAVVDGRVSSLRYEFAPDEPAGPRHVLLAQRDPNGARRPAIMPMVSFAFDPAVEPHERQATVRRLRVQDPGDRCFESPPFTAPEIGAVTNDSQR